MRQVQNPERPSSDWFYVENTKGSRRTLGSYYLRPCYFSLISSHLILKKSIEVLKILLEYFD